MSMRNHGNDSRRANERRPPREGNRGNKAPRHQQIAWGKQITGRNATPEAILTLFEQSGYRFETRNSATVVHRVAKLGGKKSRRDPRLERLIDMCGRRIGDFEPQEIANSA